jgi:DNA-binding NtrC family response regulator
VRHYLNFYARQYHKPQRPVSDDAMAALQAHEWPGNVRALRHACERAVILTQGDKLEASDFGLGEGNCETLELGAQVPEIAAANTAERPNAQHQKLVELERHAVDDAVRKSNGNISQAAKLLGLSRAALYRRLEKHGL